MNDIQRPSGRAADHLRPVKLLPGVNKYAEGSCLAQFGDTHVLVTATLEDRMCAAGGPRSTFEPPTELLAQTPRPAP